MTGIQGVTRGYRGLQRVTGGYKGFTRGYKGLQGVTRGGPAKPLMGQAKGL